MLTMSASVRASHPYFSQNPTPPKTPPSFSEGKLFFHNWPEPETFPEDEHYEDPSLFGYFEERKLLSDPYCDTYCDIDDGKLSVTRQDVLLLHAPKQRYVFTR